MRPPVSTSPKGADCSQSKTFRETQVVFSHIPHVSGSFPAVYQCPTTDVGQDPVQHVVPHLMIGRQATSSVRCASSQHFRRQNRGVPILLGHRDWTAMELCFLRHISVCSPHLWQNQVCSSCHPCHESATAPKHTDLRRRGASTELLSVCEVTFKLRRQAGRIDPYDCECLGCPE